ncbi:MULTISPECIES: restriction endonuclease [unclassified Rhizobium]|uniref:restriction endonuclease n=1 Tax=unclassified Rhizobium TaxID=2613769 RepID=UPI001AD9D855|nr:MULTISPECIES: restriction endonuclease [unclassified Rhizobium]MBO9127699.1 restriction endonuclease [Rhizobium sp. 16-488-2b]MBO9178161.1 restriction endonuclease [Rhizobium sp. 16-488-2a]
MAQLTTTDMALIDKIFGMYGGYVLDFSNDRFAAFFNRDLKIDIYHERYALHGPSKGKHFRAFLEVSPDADVVRALTALWEYREAGRLDRGEEETIPHARQRLSAVLNKIGGKALPVDADAESAKTKVAPETKGPSQSDLASLEQEFLALTVMNEAPQHRGFAFERFLKRWFDAWGLDAHASFRTLGEQIDGSFQHEGNTYLVEAKWHSRPTDAAMLHSFQGKLLERPDWTRGLYVSYGGFSGESFGAFTARRLIMMDGADIYHALNRRIDLGEVVRKKVRHHSERRQPFARVTDLFPA